MRTVRTIGILGGAGVAASAALVQRIVDIVTDDGARYDQEHPELILLQATQAPSRSLWLEGRGPSFIPAYVEAAQRLRDAGAGIVAICCNTAHAAHAEIVAAANVDIPDLITVSLQKAIACAGTDSARIGILCSSGTRFAGLYSGALARISPDACLLEPAKELQEGINEGIVAVKRGYHRRSQFTPSPGELFLKAANALCLQGADVIILGCTEIPLAFPHDWKGVPVVDTIDVLARTCLDWWADGEEV